MAKIAKEKSYLLFLPLSKVILWENVHTSSVNLLAPYANPYTAKVCPLLGLCFTENFQVPAPMHFLSAWLSQAFHVAGTLLRRELKYISQTTLQWQPFFCAEIKHLISRQTSRNVYEPRQRSRAGSLEQHTLFSLAELKNCCKGLETHPTSSNGKTRCVEKI